MLPGNIDPRRPDKQQRYKPPPASNNAAPGEDLTPDYMNILDPQRKSMQTPRSDRFKVVKIESTEPFKRGRWKCMDFLDQSYAKVFQQNYTSRPVSPKSNDANKSLCVSSTPSNVDMQSSMLQIFYRQNSMELQQVHLCTCSETKCNDKIVKNHVLMPGMVSSSLAGIDFPIDLNFVPDYTGQLPSVFKETNNIQHNLTPNHNQNQGCCCKIETSPADIQTFPGKMSSDHLTLQASQIANFAPIQQDLMQKNLNVPAQDLINQNSNVNVKYVQNLINNETNAALNYQKNSIIKDDQLENQSNSNIGQILAHNLISQNHNGSEVNNQSQFKPNTPIYVNIQNLSCSQQQQQQQASNLSDAVNINNNTLKSTEQIPTTSNNNESTIHVTTNSRIQESPIKNSRENICETTTSGEIMSQNNNNNNNKPVMNGNYVPNNNFVQNSVPGNNGESEYYQTIQTMDPNKTNLVQKFVVQNIVPNNNRVQNSVPNTQCSQNNVPNNNNNNGMIQQNNIPNNGMVQNGVQNNTRVQNCLPNNGNNVHYIVYNSPVQTSFETNNSTNNSVHIVQTQNANNTQQTLVQNNENIMASSNGNNLMLTTQNQNNTSNSNQNLTSLTPNNNNNNNINGNSKPNIQQDNKDKLIAYSNQVTLKDTTNNNTCNSYKQETQETTVFQYHNTGLNSSTCIHAFLNEERTLIQSNNSNDTQGKIATVDTKIEALMDLVKKHLKCTVMEDVNVLKHKILELNERIALLEYENELLKNQCNRNNIQ